MQCLNASLERNTWRFYTPIGYTEWYPLASPPEVCQSFKEVLSTLRSVGNAHWAHAVASALGVCLAGIYPEGKVRDPHMETEKTETQITESMLAAVIPWVHWGSDHRFGGSEVIIGGPWDGDRATAARLGHGITHVASTHQLQQRPGQRDVHQPAVLDTLGEQCSDAVEQHLHVAHTLVVRLRQRGREQTTVILDIVAGGLRTPTIVHLHTTHGSHNRPLWYWT